jgi:hypothetical protein
VRGGGIATRASATAVAAAAAFAIAGPVGTAGATPISYGFDGGSAEGWKVANNYDQPQVTAIVNPVGGNPGGHLFYNDIVGESGGGAAFVSFFSPILPAGTLAANFGGTLTFDFRIQGGAPTRGLTPRLISPQGELFTVVPVAATNAFQRVGAGLIPPGWNYCAPGGGGCTGTTEAEMRAVLFSATQIELEVDARAGTGEDYSIDNVALTDPPPVGTAPPTPVPTTPKKCKRKKGEKSAAASKKKRKKCKRKKRR